MSDRDAYAIQRALSHMADERPPTADESLRRLMRQCADAHDEQAGRNRGGRNFMDPNATPF